MYSECLNCPKIGVSCEGPNFFTMTSSETLEWCKQRKNVLHLTNAKLAELSGIPKGTVDRMLSGEQLDFRFETIRPLIKVLIGGSFDGNPCPTPHDPQIDEYTKETIERLKAENARILEEHHERVDFLKEQVRIAQGVAKGRKTAIIVLSIGLALTLLCIIAALIVDRLNPDIGFFWVDRAVEAFKGIAEKSVSNRLG